MCPVEKQSILSLIRSKKYLKKCFCGQYICVPSVDISLYERGQHTNTLPFYLALLGTRFRARFMATGKRRHMEIRLTACGKPSYGLFSSLIPER